MNIRGFNSLVKQLPGRLSTDNFLIHYGLSNPHPGRGDGKFGIHFESLVHSTAHYLERAYLGMSEMCGPSTPRTGSDRLTHVYVCDLTEQMDSAAFTFDDPERGPVIVVPCKNSVPTFEGSYQQMLAEAVHETAHIFNFTSRPAAIQKQNDAWVWIDEATAVHLERHVLPGNSAYLQYGLKWTDEPETPLDSPRFKYSSFPFVEYLMRRDAKLVPELWAKAINPGSRPFEVLSKLVGGTGNPYGEVDDHFVGFMKEFFVYAYFCWEIGTHVVLPEVFHRYGRRKHTESVIITTCNKSEMLSPTSVGHLSCRYFRVQPKVKHQGISITLHFEPLATRPDLQVIVRPMAHDYPKFQFMDPRKTQSLEPGRSKVTFSINDEESKKIEDYIVVVANCGVRADNDVPIHDDDRKFYLEVMLLE